MQDLSPSWCKKKKKKIMHVWRREDRKAGRAEWKVRGEGGLPWASPDKRAADLRQQVLVDSLSQTHGGSFT